MFFCLFVFFKAEGGRFHKNEARVRGGSNWDSFKVGAAEERKRRKRRGKKNAPTALMPYSLNELPLQP